MEQDDLDLNYMVELSKQINPNIDPEVFRTMIMLSVKEDGQEKLRELERNHLVERELLNCLRRNK